MKKVAVLGFGVVGRGVVELLTNNKEEVARVVGEEVQIAHILDLRDFPDSPFAPLLTKDFETIVSDPEVDAVVEVMGGSHPAREYTLRALEAGKHVLTSNKEVVSNFGDEFLAAAAKAGVCYRFEAAVGGGIPVLSPLTSLLRHNKIREVRGILNGTTNYILTKMFSFGESFDRALAEAQEKGYAERNPDADVLGIDACRKTAILAALATGVLRPVEKIPTEGITKVRASDVKAAEKIGAKIKLVGRSILPEEGEPILLVAPHLVSAEAALAGVSGVYNAVEVIGEPIGNVMFYGQGAGAGATASAVVADLCESFVAGRHYPAPVWKKADAVTPLDGLVCRRYLAFEKGAESAVGKAFPGAMKIPADGECQILTPPMTEKATAAAIETIGQAPISIFRYLE